MTHNKEGVPYATVQNTKLGSRLIADGGFTCLTQGQECLVHETVGQELYVDCAEGSHFLDGQLDEGGKYIGFTHKQ